MNAAPFHQTLLCFACISLIQALPEQNSSIGGEPHVTATQYDEEDKPSALTRAIELGRKGDHNKALQLYHEVIRQDAFNADAYLRRGLTYFTLGEIENAFTDSEKVIELAPRSALGYWLRGILHGTVEEDDKAYADYDKAIRLNPRMSEAYYGRGLVYHSRGQLDKAVADFDKAIELDPGRPYYLAARRRSLAALGQKQPPSTIDENGIKLANVSKNEGRSICPYIARGLGETMHMVWMDDTPGNFDIFHSLWDGDTWSKPSNLSRNATLSMFPVVAIDLEGQVHVAWMDGEHDGDMHVLYSKLTGHEWSQPKNVSSTNGISQRPQIVTDSSGKVHLVWYGNQEGFFQLYHSQRSESRWTEPIDTGLVEWFITHNPDWNMKPSLTAGTDGKVHVAWVGMEDVPSPYALTQNIRHSTWDGKNWLPPDNASQNRRMMADLEQLAISADGEGNLHAVWLDRATLWYGHFDGKRWSPPKRLSDVDPKIAMPSICHSQSGRLYVAWHANSGSKSELLLRSRTEAKWSQHPPVSKSPRSALGCSLAVDQSGHLHVAWMDDRTGEYEVLHRRIQLDQ